MMKFPPVQIDLTTRPLTAKPILTPERLAAEQAIEARRKKKGS